jgi:hypothetical protein
MATEGKNQSVNVPVNRAWQEFAYHAFARLVARKHGIAVPDVDIVSLSDEELERRTALLQELSHLPPG